MKKSLMVAILTTMSISGCGGEDQLGALQSDHIKMERSHEGFLSDLMVPDRSPEGLTNGTERIAVNNEELPERYGLSANNQRMFGRGKRMRNERIGTLQDEPSYFNNEGSTEGSPIIENEDESGSIEDKIKKRLLEHDHISKAHVVSKDGKVFIGVESIDDNRSQLKKVIQSTISDLVTAEKVMVYTDRKSVNRIRAAEKTEGRLERESFHEQLEDMEFEFERIGKEWPF